MHEAIVLLCIFGCKDKKDDVAHYPECMVLWSLIDEVFPGYVASSKSGRINYIRPSTQNVCLISVAFEVYHALKIGLRDTVACAVSTLRFAEIAKVASKLISEKYERNVRLFRVYPEGETPSEAAQSCRSPHSPTQPSLVELGIVACSPDAASQNTHTHDGGSHMYTVMVDGATHPQVPNSSTHVRPHSVATQPSAAVPEDVRASD